MDEERITFDTPYQEYAERRGQRAVMLGPVDPTSYDFDECGPLYRIRFYGGAEIQAWPEEVGYA